MRRLWYVTHTGTKLELELGPADGKPWVVLSCAPLPHPATVDLLLSNKEMIAFMVNDVESHDTIFIVKSFSF